MTSQTLVQEENVGLSILYFGVADGIQAMNVGKKSFCQLTRRFVQSFGSFEGFQVHHIYHRFPLQQHEASNCW